jgi:hypothetical protein
MLTGFGSLDANGNPPLLPMIDCSETCNADAIWYLYEDKEFSEGVACCAVHIATSAEYLLEECDEDCLIIEPLPGMVWVEDSDGVREVFAKEHGSKRVKWVVSAD